MFYSFLSVQASIAGPGGFANLASGASSAEEGITLEAQEDKNVMQIGADGRGQHSLVANDAGTATIRLLKTSPINQILMLMYNLQSASAALWGINTITVVDSARGDYHALQNVAFKKKPNFTYAKEAGIMEWTFDYIKGDSVLGG